MTPHLCISPLHPNAKVDHDGEKCPLCEMLEPSRKSNDVKGVVEIRHDPHGASMSDIGRFAPEDLSPLLKASISAIDAKKGWTRERLLRESAEHFDACLDLMKRRNTEYAKENDPFANFKRLGLLALIQEMDNVVCRMYGYADALYRGEKPKMSEEQIADCERDLPNFAALFRGKRMELEGK